jgi:predicted nucleotidyltransferase
LLQSWEKLTMVEFKSSKCVIHFLKNEFEKFNRCKSNKNKFWIYYRGNIRLYAFDKGDLNFTFPNSDVEFCLRQRTLNFNLWEKIQNLFKKSEVVYEIYIKDKQKVKEWLDEINNSIAKSKTQGGQE